MKQKAQIARAPESADDALTATLIAWGRCYGVKMRDEEPARASHPIARAVEDQGRKSRRQIAIERALARTQGRRTLMARDLSSCGVRIVPASYVDPVPCRDDSGRHRGLGADPLETPQVQTVQRAWLSLRECFPAQADVLRVEYQRPDIVSRTHKALHCGIKVERYKFELSRARHWVRSALAMARAVDQAGAAWALDRVTGEG